MEHTTFGFAARIAGGNVRAAKLVGLGVGRLMLITCFLAGAAAGLAGMVEVAAMHGRANASLAAGYGFTGILVAFLARHNPLAIIPVAILFGGIDASGGLLQRRLDLPDATVLVLQGIIFISVLASETLYGRFRIFRSGSLTMADDRLVGGADRGARRRAARQHAVPVRQPRRMHHREQRPHQSRARGHAGDGRDVRLRHLVPDRLALARRAGGRLLRRAARAVHASICGLPRVNDIAVGIALMLFGTGLAFYLGKPLIQPTAPILPAIDLGWWSDIPQVRAALKVNALFLIGMALAPLLVWALANTRWGLILRMAGESADAARAMGYSVNAIRLLATMLGGFLAGIGGSFLSLYYPGSWNEGLSSGQGLMAVALVIFARWNPVLCLWASLLFGGAAALGPALQSVGVSQGYYLFNAAPYVLTLLIMIVTCSPKRTLAGAPAELSITK